MKLLPYRSDSRSTTDMVSMCAAIVVNAVTASRRAKAAPRQKWMP